MKNYLAVKAFLKIFAGVYAGLRANRAVASFPVQRFCSLRSEDERAKSLPKLKMPISSPYKAALVMAANMVSTAAIAFFVISVATNIRSISTLVFIVSYSSDSSMSLLLSSLMLMIPSTGITTLSPT